MLQNLPWPGFHRIGELFVDFLAPSASDDQRRWHLKAYPKGHGRYLIG